LILTQIGYDVSKIDAMMSDIEAHYFQVDQPNAMQWQMVVDLLWKMLVLVEKRASASELVDLLRKNVNALDGIYIYIYLYDIVFSTTLFTFIRNLL
jgi:hypothetical protein